MRDVNIDSVAKVLGILVTDESRLAIENLRKQFQKMGGITDAAVRLRLTVLDFIEWKERRILWRPWLWFRGQGYWGRQFDQFCWGRWEQAITDELWKATKLGKTTFLDLAARMVGEDVNDAENVSLLTLREAAAEGIERLRRPIWAHPMDHIRMSARAGTVPLFIYLFCPFNQECNGRDPVEIFLGGPIGYDIDERVWVVYKGPLAESEAYKAEQVAYAGCLQGKKE